MARAPHGGYRWRARRVAATVRTRWRAGRKMYSCTPTYYMYMYSNSTGTCIRISTSIRLIENDDIYYNVLIHVHVLSSTRNRARVECGAIGSGFADVRAVERLLSY